MNDHERLAHAIGRYAAAHSSSQRRSGVNRTGAIELQAALAALADEVRRCGLSDRDLARLLAGVAEGWQPNSVMAAGDIYHWGRSLLSGESPRLP
jgi:HEAT repeat protein